MVVAAESCSEDVCALHLFQKIQLDASAPFAPILNEGCFFKTKCLRTCAQRGVNNQESCGGVSLFAGISLKGIQT